MGHKTDPRGLRLKINRAHDSNWYVDKKDYAKYLHEDIKLRSFLEKKFMNADLSRVIISRTSADKIEINLYTYKVGLILGRKGAEVDKLKKELEKMVDRKISLKVNEISYSKISAKVLSRHIAQSIEKRTPFKMAMNHAINRAKKSGVAGIKIAVGGRLNGAEIARTESILHGKVPLHSLKYDVDYATSTARTISGAIGIKVWISNGIKKGVTDVNA